MGIFRRKPARRSPMQVAGIVNVWVLLDQEPFVVQGCTSAAMEDGQATVWSYCIRYGVPGAYVTIWTYATDGPDGLCGARYRYQWAIGDDPSEPDWSYEGFGDHPDAMYYETLAGADEAAAGLIQFLAEDAPGSRDLMISAFDWNGEPFKISGAS